MTPTVAMIGVPELLIIFAIIVLLFSASQLPGLGKWVRQSVHGSRRAERRRRREARRLAAKPPNDTKPPDDAKPPPSA